MNDKITIVQNFLLSENKIKHLESSLGLISTTKVLGKCKFIVNCKNKNEFEYIKNLYENHVKNLLMFNWVEDKNFTWAKSTLKLLEHVDTPYVFYLTEDRMFHKTTEEEFSSIVEELCKENIGWMCIGKLFKYTGSKRPNINILKGKPPYLDKNKNIYTFHAKNSPHGNLSIDSVFRKDILKSSLERIKNNPEKRPHVLEEESPPWVVKKYPDLLCAIPKRAIIVSDDDPGFAKIR